MKKNIIKQFLYVLVTVVFSIFLLVSFYNLDSNVDWKTIMLFGLLAIISETFPIIGPSGATMSVGFAIYAFLMIYTNPISVVLVAAMGFIFSMPVIDEKRVSVLNQKPTICFFNLSSIIISFGIPTFIYHKIIFGKTLFHISFAFLVALIVCEILNILLLSIMFLLDKPEKFPVFIKQIAGTFFSTIGIGSLGLVLYYINTFLGEAAIAVFFIPLLLARYSYKLYFDSQRMAMETIYALNDALHVKDEYTGGHTSRVEEYSVKLARAYGLSPKEIETIKTAAFLHDIGKIGVPDAILNKQGKLTEDEYEIIKTHPTMGAKILKNVDTLKKVSQIIVHHHERYDGKGYPDKATGDEISIEAAILMIVDSYDAMTSDRPYRKALTREQTIKELEVNSGTQFNPELVYLFIQILTEEGLEIQQ